MSNLNWDARPSIDKAESYLDRVDPNVRYSQQDVLSALLGVGYALLAVRDEVERLANITEGT